MAALPDAIRYERVVAGMMDPNWDPLDHALEPFRAGPIVHDMHELGNAILGISEAMPAAGLQGVFPYIYGALTLELADAIDGKKAWWLPKFNNPDDLIKQGGHFAGTWTDPLDHLVRYNQALVSGDAAAQLEHLKQIPVHYRHMFNDREIQLGHPVIQFTAGGMDNHILGDLGRSLFESGVSEAYMRLGGDFDAVNLYIWNVTMRRALELMDGNRAMTYTALQAVPLAIGGMRQIFARRTFRQLQQAESPEKFMAIKDAAETLALRTSQSTVAIGRVILPAFGRLTGAEQWPPGQEEAA